MRCRGEKSACHVFADNSVFFFFHAEYYAIWSVFGASGGIDSFARLQQLIVDGTLLIPPIRSDLVLGKMLMIGRDPPTVSCV